MKQLFFVLLAGILVGCTHEKPGVIAESRPLRPNSIKMQTDYNAFKNSVVKHRKELASRPYREKSDYFFRLINNDIFSYWEGTPWNFYGTTRIPKSGNIACGYFVTTTLEDIGLKIDRIKLAECRSGDMIKVLCTDIHTFKKTENLEAFLKSQPKNSVFIIGLDFHTGYIVKDSANSYFMHSYYANNKGVIKEKVEDSPMLHSSSIFMIGSLTSNKKLLEQWVAE